MTLRNLLLALPLLVLGCSAVEEGDTGAETGTEGGSDTTTTTTESGGNSCMPGEVEACLCPDQSGSTQICLADGSGFSACDCAGGSAEDDSAESASSMESSGEAESSGSATAEDTTGSETDGGSTEGPMPECDGSSHPLVDGDLRYCEPGNCYCGDFTVDPPFDTCYVEAIADACCPVEVVCY